MCKLAVFLCINRGDTLGSIDANALQEAYADSNDFWDRLSYMLSCTNEVEIIKAFENLREQCLEVSGSLLDQAIEEQRELNMTAFIEEQADDQG